MCGHSTLFFPTNISSPHSSHHTAQRRNRRNKSGVEEKKKTQGMRRDLAHHCGVFIHHHPIFLLHHHLGWCVFLLFYFCIGVKPYQNKKKKERLTLLYLLNRAYLQTHTTPYTNLLIDLRVLKPFLVFFHSYRPFGAYRITRCAATAIFFSGEKNWYIFHCCFVPFCGVLINIYF